MGKKISQPMSDRWLAMYEQMPDNELTSKGKLLLTNLRNGGGTPKVMHKLQLIDQVVAKRIEFAAFIRGEHG